MNPTILAHFSSRVKGRMSPYHCPSIIDKKITPNGKKIIKKRFVPTTSFEAALTILNKKYGLEDFLKFKHDASPGQVSVAVSDEYLSVGPFVESLDEVGVHTQHKMHYAPHYASDILSFERAPEKTIDFYTLNSSDIREAIKEFKSSSTVYSLLGDFSRFRHPVNSMPHFS